MDSRSISLYLSSYCALHMQIVGSYVSHRLFPRLIIFQVPACLTLFPLSALSSTEVSCTLLCQHHQTWISYAIMVRTHSQHIYY